MHRKPSNSSQTQSTRKSMASAESSPGIYMPIYDSEGDKDLKETKDYGAINSAIVPHRKQQSDDTYDPYDNLSDNDAQRWKSNDDFGEFNSLAYSSARTGRHRRKLAARTKGGEFQASRRKRRLYFCCIGSEIDIQKVHDHVSVTNGWDLKLYGDCLRLFRPGNDTLQVPLRPDGPSAKSRHPNHENDDSKESNNGSIPQKTGSSHNIQVSANSSGSEKPELTARILYKLKQISKPSTTGTAQEVYIFEFGAAVFWGFPKGEEITLLDFIKEFVTNGMLVKSEFEEGEDDFGFVTSREDETISISNDVITMPENTVEKQRLAVSYAIAQSSILAIFEARVEKKVEEYKYIPETLAARGQINLTHKQIGRMIGEIFVVRHDVNLHTVVLDTPDFFWKQEEYEKEYRMMMRYLEMTERVDTVNKRLDMLKELLDVLEQQLESAHASKLEWIVIWLIIIEIAIEFLGIAGEVLGIWSL